MEGLLEELRVVEMSTGARILVRNDEVFVPKGEREHMLEVLHLGHHSADTMLRNCRGRVFFPKMRQRLLEKYNNCQACTLCRVSRMSPKTEVDYSDVFLNYFPGQMVEMDYLEYHGDDYLSIVDLLRWWLSLCLWLGYWQTVAVLLDMLSRW